MTYRPAAGSSPLSIHSTFVVQFRDETDVAYGRIAGRIEHVASRESASFRSWPEMKEFMANVLGKVRTNAPETT